MKRASEAQVDLAIQDDNNQNLNQPIPYRYYWLIFLAAACLRVTLTSLGALIEEISIDLQLSKAITSLVVTIPTLCMGICALFAAPLSHRIGLERTITLALLVIALSTFFRSHYSNVAMLMSFSFLMGTGIAVVGPLASGFVKRYFGRQSTKGMFLYSLGISISGILGTFGTTILSSYFNLKWNSALEFWAWPILGVFLFWAICYLRPIAQASRSESEQVSQKRLSLPWREKKVWILVACFGLQSGAFYTLVTWLVPYLEEQGIPQFHSHIMLNLFMINGILGSFLFPFLLARFRKEVAVYSCSLSAMLAFAGLWLGGGEIVTAYIMIFILGMTTNAGMFIIVLTLPFYEVDNGDEIARWTAMISFGGYIISAMMPTIFGYIFDLTGSYSNVLLGLWISSILLIGCFSLFLYSKSGKDQKHSI